MAGLTIMESLDKFVSLDDYLFETLRERLNHSVQENVQLIPKPVAPFLTELLAPAKKMLSDFETGPLQMHLYNLSTRNVLLNVQTCKRFYKTKRRPVGIDQKDTAEK